MTSGDLRVVFVALHSAPDAAPALGAGCIASALLQAGAVRRESLSIVEAEAETDPGLLADAIRREKPEVVGFSLYCWNTLVSIRIAEILRSGDPHLKLIAGGPDAVWASGVPEGEVFDAIFTGEAEAAVVDWFRSLGHAVSGEARPGGVPPRRASPESLPSPWLDGVLEASADIPVAWELSRGCPFNCAYCYEGRGSRGVRYFPMERLEAELSLFADSGVREIFVLDPTFNVDRKRSLQLLSLFRKKAPRISWNFEVRAELVDPAQAEAFALLDAALQIGLQSCVPEVLATVGRSMDREKFVRGIGYLEAAGVVYGFDLIYGLPADTFEGFAGSVDFALSLRPNHLDIFPLALLPGTELYENRITLGLEADPRPPYLLARHGGFSLGDMARAGTLAGAIREFYARGRAVPWFMPVTKALGLKPSAFFDSYDTTLSDLAPHSEIEIAQRAFVARMFRERGKDELAALADELIRYHGAWSRAFAEGESAVLDLCFSPGDLDQADSIGLERLAQRKRPRPARVQIYPSGNGPSIREIRA